MTTTRKQYSPKFKATVAVEAIRGERTLSRLGLPISRVAGADRPVAQDRAGLGRRALSQLATIVTPETLLAWHRSPPAVHQMILSLEQRG